MAEVILVHGLWYGRVSMAPLSRRLRAAGFAARTFAYPSIFRDPATAARRLAQQLPDSGPVYLVGHSLGGLVILQALARHEKPITGRVVLLGTPLNGSCVARRMAGLPLLHRLLGQSSEVLQRGSEPAEAQFEIGMIAGTAGRGLGRLSGAINGPSDGTVMLSETRHPLLTANLELPVGHTGMLFSAAVAAQARQFLEHGSFATH